MLCRRELCPRQKGGRKVGKTKRGKGTKWMVVVDGAGTPLGVHLDSASPAEVKLLETTLDTIAVTRAHRAGRPRRRPDRLVADRGYDSNPLRAALVQRGIEPIIPARSNNPKATHQDGRRLRRYRHRWIIERTFAWLGHFRRLVVRYERHDRLYGAFFHLACALLTLKRVLK
ncbi:MAG TPA: IS5 family transposase [Anaerolineales bacterium]|nr:IS5 family transposase [Anaerolineales bacterium]